MAQLPALTGERSQCHAMKCHTARQIYMTLCDKQGQAMPKNHAHDGWKF